MPQVFYKQTRRSFLRTTAQLAGAYTTAYGLGVSSVLGASAPDETPIALLSDTHVSQDMQNQYRGFFPYQNLQQVVPQVVASKPEAMLINGDVARLVGEKADYSLVKQLLEPVAQQNPVYMTLGNHDHREHIQEVFSVSGPLQPVKDKRVLVVELPYTRFILLDSLMFVNKTPGFLGQDQRKWLQTYLQQSDQKPTVIFVHHTLSDNDSSLLDTDKFFAIIRPFRQVKAVFYGHSHVYSYDTLDGIHLINQPAVGYNFSDDQPIGWLSGKFGKQGVDLTLHAIAGNRSDDNKTKSLGWR
ncbi:metallophosphoesterase family protein [Arundinibacter roseus]|uniref:Phosphohydrolase n=1 Tax=Arundinibacter roseus TaxID=2070510 RepID=A0A4R4KHE5_9BACT|nr:metallophosphoesterase [Arundinibacter roseus]TDB67514.1 phosphohydrolase [Arundinibacter roseus]